MAEIQYVFLIIIGLLIGSFLNVCIYRIPLKLSIVFPRSFCTKCKRQIRGYENIPLFSFIFLKGRCAGCRSKISWRYPAVELLTSLIIVYAYYRFGNSWSFLFTAIFACFMIVIAFIDLQYQLIFDRMTYPLAVIGIVSSFFIKEMNLIKSIIGLIVGGGLLFLVAFLAEKFYKMEAMGFGDINLMAASGTFLGGWNVLLSIIIASFIGAFAGVLLILFGVKKGLKEAIPFGPFLAAGNLVVIFWGEKIMNLINLYSSFGAA